MPLALRVHPIYRQWYRSDSINGQPNHTYTTAGSYEISLTVTDNQRATASAFQTALVTVPPSPLSIVTQPQKVKKGPCRNGTDLRV